jgi:hypothetical protein
MTPNEPVARAREALKAGSEYDAHHFLVGELADLVEQLRAENARLRRQNKESSDAWQQRTRRMQSDFADLRNDFRRGLEMLKDTACAEGSHYSTDADGNRQVSCSWNDRCYMAAARVLLDDQASVIQRLRAGEVEDVEHLQWVRPDDPADPDTTFTFAPMSEGEAAVLAQEAES